MTPDDTFLIKEFKGKEFYSHYAVSSVCNTDPGYTSVTPIHGNHQVHSNRVHQTSGHNYFFRIHQTNTLQQAAPSELHMARFTKWRVTQVNMKEEVCLVCVKLKNMIMVKFVECSSIK